MEEFQRFTASDAAALEAGIRDHRDKLAAAVRAGTAAAIIEHAADLGTLLITARRETEALQVLQEQLTLAGALPELEATGWFWNAYATALQYLDRRDEADSVFAKALALTREGGWLRLQSFVLQHRGRSQVEQGRWQDAEASFCEALHLRQQLNDPLQASTQRALEGLMQRRKSRPGEGAA